MTLKQRIYGTGETMIITKLQITTLVATAIICIPVFAKWEIQVGEDVMSDKKTAIAFIANDNDSDSQLWISCNEDEPIGIGFSRNSWILDTDKIMPNSWLHYRIDKNEKVRMRKRTYDLGRPALLVGSSEDNNWKYLVRNMRAGNLFTIDAKTSVERMRINVEAGVFDVNSYNAISRGNHTFRHSFTLVGFTSQYAQACQWHPEFE